MRRFINIVEAYLTEYRVLRIPAEYIVYTNPTQRDLLRLLERFHQLRGMFANRVLYVWSAEEATHYEIARQVGLDLNEEEPDYLHLFFSDTKDICFDWIKRVRKAPAGFYWAAWPPKKALANPRIRRLLGVPEPMSLTERKSEFEVLKQNRIALTAEERQQVMDAGAVWHHGPGGKPSPAIWKAKDSKGNIKYVCNTHRCYQVRDTLADAIKTYPEVEATS